MLRKLDEMLDEYVYQKIWSTLTGRERDIIVAMNEGEAKVEEVRNKADISSESFSPYRDKLIAKGIMISPRYGYVSLTLPRFPEVARTYRSNSES